jgi:hypothetical protein
MRAKLTSKLEKIECEICGCKEIETLHRHHVVERKELNTSNDPMNLLITCANCHTKIHFKKIKIIGIYPSTRLPYGRTVIYEIDGKQNIPDITKPYCDYQPKQTKLK